MEVLNKAKLVISRPDQLFESVKKEDLGPSFMYYAILLFVPTVAIAILLMIAGSFDNLMTYMIPWNTNVPQNDLVKDGMSYSVLSSLGIMIAAGLYIMTLIGSFINAAIMHVFVYIVGGRKGYLNTYKAFAYANTPSMLFSWIPIAGLVGFVWTLVLEVKGIRILHETTTGRAALAVLLPITIVVGLIAAALITFLLVAGFLPRIG